MIPNSPSLWTKESEIENLKKAKISSIERFEALQDEEIKIEKTKNFAEKYATKIIENLQITIKNIHIRYEDNNNNEDDFAFGMVLREIKAFSCDSNWNPSFNTDDTMCFKQIHLESLSVYLDYNVEVINILK